MQLPAIVKAHYYGRTVRRFCEGEKKGSKPKACSPISTGKNHFVIVKLPLLLSVTPPELVMRIV